MMNSFSAYLRKEDEYMYEKGMTTLLIVMILAVIGVSYAYVTIGIVGIYLGFLMVGSIATIMTIWWYFSGGDN